MSKAIVRIENNSDIYLRETGIENLFISEYLPAAPGDYVRVYIYGKMAALNQESFELEKFARILGMSRNEVDEAWRYWARKGIINLFHAGSEDDIGIEFVNLVDRMYAKVKAVEDKLPSEEQTVKAVENDASEDSENDKNVMPQAEENESAAEKIVRMIDEGIKEVYREYERYTGRLLSTREMESIADAVHVYNINPEVMSYAIKYCVELEKYNASYIIKVALRWTSEGCRNIADVKDYIDRYSKRNAEYGSIFKELGFNRLPSPAEREIMSGWMDKMGFRLDEIIDACRRAAGIREPSLKYVNKILENKILETGGINTRNDKNKNKSYSDNYKKNDDSSQKAKVSKAVLDEYYEYLRYEAERKQDARIDEICSKYSEMRELFDEENDLNQNIMSLSFKPDSKKERAELKEKRKTLENSKRKLLFEIGYPVDYLDRRYSCRICRDTGMTDEGLLCACREKRAEEAYRWKKEKTK